MTKDKKWLTVCIAGVIAFYLGWAFPWIWAIAVILIILVLISPTKPAESSSTPISLPLDAGTPTSHAELAAIEKSLSTALNREQNADVRRGIQIALDTLKLYAPQTSAVVSAVTPQAAPVAMRSPEDLAQEKEKQELRNINTILYVASFLLVGAAALFVGYTSEIDQVGKFIALVVVTGAFYGAGMGLYHAMPKIRPAAIAFVGTGLALIPFVGLGLYNYVLPDAALAWWLTSLVGLVAFWVALLSIRTQFMSYLTLAFVFSLTTSSVSVLDTAFVWYFVVVIVTASIMRFIGHRYPSSVPAEMRQPLEHNAELAAPLALVGSLLAATSLTLPDYVLISGVGALHYAVGALGYPRDRSRYLHWSAARLLTIVFVALLTQWLADSIQWTGLIIIVTACLSHTYSVQKMSEEARESLWFWAAQFLVVMGTTMLFDDMWNVSLGLVVLAALSAHQLLLMKRSEFSIGLIAALILLPLTCGRGAIVPAIDYKVLAVVVLVVAGLAFALRTSRAAAVSGYRQALQAIYGLLATEAAVLSCIQSETAWTATVFVTLSFLVYYAAFVERQAKLHIISNGLAIIGTFLLLKEAGVSAPWLPLATAWLLGMLWYALRWYHELYNDEEPDVSRIDIMFVSSAGILAVAAFYSAIADDVTGIAGALTGLIVAAQLAAEGKHRAQLSLYELAVSVATISLQWLVHRAYPEAGLLFYTHWWALSIALTGLLRLYRQDKDGAKLRGIIALGMISVPTGLYALSDPFTYQYLFLLEHVALLIAGFVLQRKLIIRWSSIAIGLALLWLLSGFTYVLLAIIALGLIGLAIRRLMSRS